MAAANICAGCLQVIPDREFLVCSICKNKYDLECTNVSSKRFYSTLTGEYREKWRCQLCINKIPKVNNQDTPIRPRLLLNDDFPTTSTSTAAGKKNNNSNEHNITLRKKCAKINQTLSSSEEDISIPGDTIELANTPAITKICDIRSETMIEKLKDFLNEKLDHNNHTLINDLKSIIKCEISTAITEFQLDTTEKLNQMHKIQDTFRDEIGQIMKKIDFLQSENQKLQKEMQNIEQLTKNATNNTLSSLPKEKNLENDKKIVLYGLQENYWESENELYERTIWIFQEILQVDLSGYIEDLSRIGKSGNARPLVIELLSKKTAKYILNNRYYFRNTGLGISEFLDKTSLQEKRDMRKALLEARRRGQHAVLRDGVLIINGQAQQQSLQNDNVHAKYPNVRSQKNLRKTTATTSSPPTSQLNTTDPVDSISTDDPNSSSIFGQTKPSIGGTFRH